MKLLFTSKGKNWADKIDPRFGRTEFFFIYDEEKDEVNVFDNREIVNVAHGAGPQTVQKMTEFNANVLITGNGPGGNAAQVISQTGIEVYVGASNMTIKEAYDAYKNGTLTKI